jgi:hypothetical protein
MKLSKLFYNDYQDNYIEERQAVNVCGDILKSRYRLRIAKYRFGIKSYFIFYHDYGDYQSHVYTDTKEELMTEFKEFRLKYKIVKHLDRIICD